MTEDTKLTKEKQIVNSFGIVDEFKCSFWSPRPWGRSYTSRYNRPGKAKRYTPEEIIVYRMKQLKHTTFCGN